MNKSLEELRLIVRPKFIRGCPRMAVVLSDYGYSWETSKNSWETSKKAKNLNLLDVFKIIEL